MGDVIQKALDMRCSSRVSLNRTQGKNRYKGLKTETDDDDNDSCESVAVGRRDTAEPARGELYDDVTPGAASKAKPSSVGDEEDSSSACSGPSHTCSSSSSPSTGSSTTSSWPAPRPAADAPPTPSTHKATRPSKRDSKRRVECRSGCCQGLGHVAVVDPEGDRGKLESQLAPLSSVVISTQHAEPLNAENVAVTDERGGGWS